MALGIDHTAIALTANHGSHLFHLGGHIHFSHRRGIIFASVFHCYVTQSACRTQVAHGRTLHMVENIIGHTHERVFLAIHFTVLADKCQAIHIGVYHDAQVIFPLGTLAHDASEIALYRLRVMGKIAGGIAIEECGLHAQSLEQRGQNHAAHRVYRIDHHLEMGVPDCIYIHQLEREHGIDMPLVEAVIFGIAAEMIHVGKLKIFFLGNGQHLLTIIVGQKLALVVEQFQRVPVSRVMACGNDDTPLGFCNPHGKLRSGGRGQSDVDHIVAHSHQRTADHAFHHLARDAGVTPHNNLVA